jgi:FG-GAP-like repeat
MNIKIFLQRSVSMACLVLLATAQVILLPFTGTASGRSSLAPAAIIYDNGPLSTGSTSKSGVASPAGFTWSELSLDNGGGNFSNTTLGAGCQQIGATTNNRCADNFIVPAGQTWTINTVIVYGYQTNSVSNPFISANLRIWNGRPGDAGVATIFGDTTTNRMTTPVDSTWFRIGNTLGGAGGVGAAATGTTRKIWAIPLTVSPALVLTSGNYWVDFQLNGGTGGNFTPLVSVPGARSLPGWNGRQFIGTNAAWADIIDIGEPATTPTQTDVVPDVQMEFPFRLDGSISGASAAPPTSRFVDFDGDNKTDFSVARSASAATQTTWYTHNSGGTETFIPFGTGVGFSAGDKATPGDFDGDGKTDITVWRSGPGGTASFYILQSSNGAFRAEQFGQTGDDPAVVGDYDGDGKDDPAVYRNGSAGGQSFFYYRGSLSNPGGGTTFVPWGTGGDIAEPGDFDGDGKADFAVARASGGSFTHYQLRSTAGFTAVPWGLSTDKIVNGDFDGDLRSDIAVARASGGTWNWYVLMSASQELLAIPWGNSTSDFLTPGDYDGDGKTDFAVWRSGQAADQTNFFVLRTASAATRFEWGESSGAGTAPDYPTANFAVK